ncbi:MAG: undecaprenyl/decaprenyl-phosphate alpha-N-acetylglucosaminyl 1-phosphate transferase [Candidatus Cloacimonetes bacterium]|nr:undecaprenyl/decaprenyl-phosphate alpha-N-acetylglucosaminyl 1-phosphate transferase [Candidatus Cloacimonadota bacterium]
MNGNYLYLLCFAFAIYLATHALMPFNLWLSKRLKIIALPNERRINKTAVPEAGGLSFALPIVICQALLGFFAGSTDTGKMLLQLAGVGVLALLFGLWDDRYESKARFKLVWQSALGIIMYLIGYRVLYLTNPLGEHFILGWLSFPATVFWYLIVLNAINLIDGMDGLASGITVIVGAVLLIVGIRESNILVVSISGFLIAGNLAFLSYNFHPARIFMGETGAMFIGLNLAAISTAGTSQFKGITSMTLMIPLAALAVPLLDVVLAVFRRIRLGNIFKADKAHIHHTMLEFGFTQRTISIIVYIVTLLFGLIAIGFSFSSKKILFSVLLGLLSLMVIIAYLIMRREKK